MQFTVTKLKTRHPRKGELWGKNSVGMTKGIAKGTVRVSDNQHMLSQLAVVESRHSTKVCGIGKEMDCVTLTK